VGAGNRVGERREDNGRVTVIQPMLSLWDEPAPDHRDRIVARSADRVTWLRARSRGITATDVARLSGPASVHAVASDKISGNGFGGNAYTDHGRAREPEIARWVEQRYGIVPSDALFHAAGTTAHLATPDGLALTASGSLELTEIKTTKSAWRSIPRSYLRQVWWQQYVLGADRTLLVWEQHDDFVPTNSEPECRWIDRDEDQIHLLVQLANQVLDAVDSRRARVPAAPANPPR
jgi:hypothetical protein